MPSLRELQVEVLKAVLSADDGRAAHLVVERGIATTRRLGIYANNVRVNFHESLQASFPGFLGVWWVSNISISAPAGIRSDFRQCAGIWNIPVRASRDYLAELHAVDEFRYLGDVARLEWLRQEALIGADHRPLDFEKLAAVAPSDKCLGHSACIRRRVCSIPNTRAGTSGRRISRVMGNRKSLIWHRVRIDCC